MPKDFNQIFREAAELSEQDRATLAGLLIESASIASHVESAFKRPPRVSGNAFG